MYLFDIRNAKVEGSIPFVSTTGSSQNKGLTRVRPFFLAGFHRSAGESSRACASDAASSTSTFGC
jgi:hypothetical protein